jgi:3D (Asp-Asp-Asp) domain-containing protein
VLGRGPLRRSHLLAITIFAAGLVFAGTLTHPSPAYAGNGSVRQTHSLLVTFDAQDSALETQTGAATVGDFLRERGVVVAQNDYLSPAAQTPISDRMTITYRNAVPVTIVQWREKHLVTSAADDVGSLLEEQGIRLAPTDEVQPTISSRVPNNGVVKITRVVTWERAQSRTIPAKTEQRLDFNLSPGKEKILAKGANGLRAVTVAYVQRDGGSITARVVTTRIVRKPSTRIVAVGASEYEAFEHVAQYGMDHTSRIAATALSMVATAYTAGCYGCSGITASGRPAGHGIVAVDPRFIPLGTRLYIPGYGFAIAGDTGGAIIGNRIDLGFNSYSDAIRFGRRAVTVYRLR